MINYRRGGIEREGDSLCAVSLVQGHLPLIESGKQKKIIHKMLNGEASGSSGETNEMMKASSNNNCNNK